MEEFSINPRYASPKKNEKVTAKNSKLYEVQVGMLFKLFRLI